MVASRRVPWHRSCGDAYGKVIKTSRHETIAESDLHPNFRAYFSNWTEESGDKKRRFRVVQVVEHPSTGLGRDLVITVDGKFISPHTLPPTHTAIPVRNINELGSLAKAAKAAHAALIKPAK